LSFNLYLIIAFRIFNNFFCLRSMVVRRVELVAIIALVSACVVVVGAAAAAAPEYLRVAHADDLLATLGLASSTSAAVLSTPPVAQSPVAEHLLVLFPSSSRSLDAQYVPILFFILIVFIY
jgi:hypothetical protein